MDPKTTTWTSGTTTITITTAPGDGEGPEAFCDRHEATVAEAQEIFPPELMKYIAALAVLLLASCKSTGLALGEQEQAHQGLTATLKDPTATQADIDAAIAAYSAKTGATIEAIRSDLARIKAEGWEVPDKENFLLTALGGGLLWWMRNGTRKKELAKKADTA